MTKDTTKIETKKQSSVTEEKASKPAAKRTMLSPAEKLAKMKADLEAQEAKVAATNAAKVKVLNAQRDKLMAKSNEAIAKVEAIDAELRVLNGQD